MISLILLLIIALMIHLSILLFVRLLGDRRNNEADDIHMPAASENVNLKFYL